MRASKKFFHILIILMLSLLCVSCEGNIPEASDTYTETPSEAVTTEECIVPDDSSSVNETESATSEEITTEEVTTEEATTEEVTTEETTTEDVTTEVLTEEETTSEPEVHTHMWGAWNLSKPAECVNRGEEKRTCACGENEIRYTDPIGHNEGRLVILKKATCTEKGYGERICSRCTIILRGETIPENGHILTVTLDKATCTEPGAEITSCKVCESELNRKVLAALGHTEGKRIVVNKPTCTEDGLTNIICAVCTAVIGTETEKAYGHTEGQFVTVKNASCTEDGYGNRICSKCRTVIHTEIISAKGHTPVVTVKNATCTDDGAETTDCKTCGSELSRKVLAAIGHTEGRCIVVLKPTCTESGINDVICQVCTLVLRTETVMATGHTVGPWITSDELSTEDISVRQKRCVSCNLLMEEERIKSLALVEAERVSAAVNAVRGNNSFTFAAMSDIHIDNVGTGYNQIPTKKSAEFAVRTLTLMEKLADIKMLALLGDYTASSPNNYSVSNVKSDFEYVRGLFDGLGDYPVAWIRGNHENNYFANSERPLTNDEIFENIESNSRGLTVDPLNPKGGYGYIDFPENKIRMIFLNTSDVYAEHAFIEGEDAPSVGVSSVQLKWLASVALDFSDKADACDWGIIINSHVPLDQGNDAQRVLKILEAYKSGLSGRLDYVREGKSYSVEYSFSLYNRAEIICSIHGHIHNFKYDKISSSSAVSPWLWRICVPNVCTLRENQYAQYGGHAAEKWGEFDENGDPLYYTKCYWDDILGKYIYDETAGTSYCIFTINREEKMIYVHYVGTGYDRVISYDN